MADDAETLREHAAFCRGLAEYEPDDDAKRGLIELAEAYEAQATRSGKARRPI